MNDEIRTPHNTAPMALHVEVKERTFFDDALNKK